MECKAYLENLPDVTQITDKPEDVCPVDWALQVAYTVVQDNCGMSVVCRDGMKQIYTIIKDVTQSRATSDDLVLLHDICQTIMEYEGCEYSHEAANLILKSLDTCSGEWSKHILRKRCTALVCRDYYTVHVDPGKCRGDGRCIAVCPHGAIAGGSGLISVINHEQCTRCGRCYTVCAQAAIIKAGAVKPKGPDAPVLVGGFNTDEAAAGRSRRRRR